MEVTSERTRTAWKWKRRAPTRADPEVSNGRLPPSPSQCNSPLCLMRPLRRQWQHGRSRWTPAQRGAVVLTLCRQEALRTVTREEIIAANPLPQYLTTRGHELRPAGKNFVTNACPITHHQKFHRCMTIATVKNLWHCNDCKRGGTVIDWVMIERNVSAADAMRMLGAEQNISKRKLKLLAKTYDYIDEHGKLLFQTCRYRPKGFKQRQPDGKGGWIYNIEDVRRVLYRLPEVIAAQTVCVPEGEKDVDNVRSLGFTATCNPMGAGKWRAEYSETLRSKDVVIFGDVGDEDGAGERHTAQVIQSLKGVAKSIKHVRLPDGFHDVSDYIASLPKESAAETIRRLIDETPLVGSFNSLVPNCEDEIPYEFPEPMSDVAFHGLAGDIVRRIEPHTEADCAALLIQTLAIFGNVIGRSAYAVADGSRHATNLFAVLVGESSKSRKGTSLAHVLRLFERADEQWKQNCIGHGLSSGEGLIWAVRDPIMKRVRQRNGSYLDEIADAGVNDKRLCVHEGEFANVLKVIPRDGNTLSPVIRSAWDNGNLRSMTKNSEARATGAHVSIIGHITKDELRRLLTETESANGFGNRFLWTAVRRSKCLPDGGNIEDGDLDDLVVRLQKAIEFAHTVSQVTRSDETRKLWHIVYPELSAGKPGLLGAITARAEAQVLRLSSIYALLDCSTEINVDHHRAALALWNYCDRSAKWIFATATGDSRADRILLALRVAGGNGMTQTEISERVFTRNVSSNALSDALRILHQSGQVKFTKESTGGAPRKRWFIANA
jgi:CHC2 zinc finger